MEKINSLLRGVAAGLKSKVDTARHVLQTQEYDDDQTSRSDVSYSESDCDSVFISSIGLDRKVNTDRAVAPPRKRYISEA